MKLLSIFILALLSNPLFATSNSDIEARLAELESQLEELQYKDYARYYTISGQLINHYESYQETKNPDTSKDKNNINALGSIFRLNVNFDVNKNLKVYTRLGMSKLWNHDSEGTRFSGIKETNDPWHSSFSGSQVYRGSTPRLDRAYMAYHFDRMPLTFAIGRLPTNQGPPYEKMDGTPRQGTYPRFAYNAIYDGVGLAYNGKNWMPSGQFLDMRFFYSPFINLGDSRRSKRVQPNSSGVDRVYKTLTPQYTAQVEYQYKNFNWVKNFHLMLFVNNYQGFQSLFTDGDDTVSTDDYPETFDATSKLYYIGFDNIFNTGWSFNVSHSNVSTRETDLSAAGMVPSASSYNSYATLVNTTYTFDNNFNGGDTVGFEYIKTDKYYYIDEFNYYFINDFYKSASVEGIHGSYNFLLTSNIRLRLGVFHYRTTQPLFGGDYRDVDSYYTTLTTTF